MTARDARRTSGPLVLVSNLISDTVTAPVMVAIGVSAAAQLGISAR